MAPKDKTDAQFSFETIACVLAVMEGKGNSLGSKAYKMMAKLDGTRTESSFEHQFRAVKARAKELAAEKENESPAATTLKSTKKTPVSTGKKRGKKNIHNADDDVEETPTKKTKVKQEATEEPSNHNDDGFGLNGNHYENAMGPQ